MLKKLFYLATLIIILSCQDRQPNVDATIIDSLYRTPVSNPEPIKTSKYYFMVIVAEQPTGIYTTDYDSKKHIERNKVRHTTDIIEVTDDITEDYKYRELDTAENDVREDVFNKQKHYYEQLASAWSIEDANTEGIIITRNFYVYDTYAEASKARQEVMKNLIN